MMFPMSNDDFQVVYDILSFSLACMMSCTLFLWMRVPSVTERYKTPLLISGLVTFIAAYHYIRIFNSWVEAYRYPAAKDGIPQAPEISGIPFNDAYRYMDWLLTVPLLLMEIVLTMSLPEAEANSKCWSLGIFSALMIVSGYRGELVIQGDLTTRWTHWFVSMCFFSYVVYTLLIGLADATNAEPDPRVKKMLKNAQVVTCVSWCTYPIVYLFPMIGIHGSRAVVAIQIGYCTSDVISKCLVGLMIYQITIYKSQTEAKLGR
jgi:bacteriorhodopsin